MGVVEVPTTQGIPLAIHYMISLGAIESSQDRLERASQECSLGGLFCSDCQHLALCKRLYDRMTNKNLGGL